MSFENFSQNTLEKQAPKEELESAEEKIERLEKENQLLRELNEALEAKLQRMEHDLIHDSLTGLKTRAFFNQQVRESLNSIAGSEKSQRKEDFGYKNLSIVFSDIDNFKSINDSLGHDSGDEVLRKVAETIMSCLRDTDIAARWGGEEMVISLLGANEEEAANKAEQIRKAIEDLDFEGYENLKVTVSIGVASTSSEENKTVEELVSFSDEAMYAAKQTGKNRVVRNSELQEDTHDSHSPEWN